MGKGNGSAGRAGYTVQDVKVEREAARAAYQSSRQAEYVQGAKTYAANLDTDTKEINTLAGKLNARFDALEESIKSGRKNNAELRANMIMAQYDEDAGGMQRRAQMNSSETRYGAFSTDESREITEKALGKITNAYERNLRKLQKRYQTIVKSL